MIKPQPPEPIKLSHGPIRGPSFDDAANADGYESANHWRAAYARKSAEFARETLKTSTLILALQALGCRAAGAHHPHCPGCLALFNVDAIDPAPAETPETGSELKRPNYPHGSAAEFAVAPAAESSAADQ